MSSQETEMVLVTGAAGFVASHLVEELLRKGYSIIGIDNFDPFYPAEMKRRNLAEIELVARSFPGRFTFIEKDINNLRAEDFRDLAIKKVAHLAGKAGVRASIEAPDAYINANVRGTVSILEFCRKRQINQICFGSSSSVYGNANSIPFMEEMRADFPASPYAATKLAGELFCKTYAELYGMRIAVLRFFTVYGPRQRPDLAIHKFTSCLFQRKPLDLFGDGKSERDYTFVNDISKGVSAALRWLETVPQATFEVFNLGSGRPIALISLVRMLENLTGRTAKLQWLPKVQGEMEVTYANLRKSERILGYCPQTSLAAGLSAFVEWFLKQEAGKFKTAA